LRNCCVVAGNLKLEEAVPALVRALREDTSPLVRGHAAWALGEIGNSETALEEALEKEPDDGCRQEIEHALRDSSWRRKETSRTLPIG
jgi:epoxyqueuosine reductase